MATITESITSKIPAWIGFLALIVVGALMIIIGAFLSSSPNAQLGMINFGIWAVLTGAFSWIAGGSSKVTGRAGRVGVKVAISDLPWWAWLVNAVLLAAAIIIFVASV